MDQRTRERVRGNARIAGAARGRGRSSRRKVSGNYERPRLVLSSSCLARRSRARGASPETLDKYFRQVTGAGIQRESKGGIESGTTPVCLRGWGTPRRRDDEAGMFALRYIVARLISRIYSRKELVREGKSQRGNEEGTNLVHASSVGERRRQSLPPKGLRGVCLLVTRLRK